MKIALCTTTVHVPHALKVLHKFAGSNVKFFVAGDRKTPSEAYELVRALGENAMVCLPESGHKWKCSEAIGFDCIQRRNIAFLEAIAWGADAIYSHDDDNLAIEGSFFERIEMNFEPFSGIKLTSENGWFDPGQLLIPPTRHRGFPYQKPPSKIATHKVGAKVGVAAGLVIGDPDIDASTRIETRPDIGQVHIFGSTGVVVNPHTWTVFNAQNTAIIRDLVPAFFQMPGVGRHDDIYASLIVQRVARERGYHVHFGPPFTYQQRNTHDLLVDLRAEIDGMGNVTTLASVLDAMHLPGKSVIGDVRRIYENLRATCTTLIPYPAIVAALAYLDDCEGLGL